MCGFAAFFSNNQSKINQIFLKDAQNMMRYRGPDASKVWISPDENVGLCHNRLSIIDLSKAANQPLWNTNGNLLIVFNGEIYNHKQLRLDLEKKGLIFKTHSDTEVILVLFEEFGEKCVSMLVGMFSFCIYDHINKIVFGARDISGEKPLYYLHTETTIYFSSEFHPLQKLSIALGKNSLDKKNLAKILTIGFACSDGTINFNIKKIKPGHTFKYYLEDNHLSTSQYFDVNKLSLNKPIYISEAKQKFTKVFSEVVKNQLDADVEVGVLLSGGIDSSLVTAFASQYREKVRTYSVSFQGNELYDESKYAKQIADFFKTKHVEINLKDISLNDFKAVIDSVDDPVIDSSFIPTYLIMREIKKHQKVVLGGDGADELFGGYKHYKRLSYIHFFQRFIPDQILKILLGQIEKHFVLGKKGSNWLRSIVYPLDKIPPLVNPIFDHSQIFDITNKKVNVPINFACDIQRYQINCKDLIGSFMKYDFNSYLPGDLLVKVDRNSMCHSVEVRSPFLDYRVIEFAFKDLPSEFKIKNGKRKYFLQEVAKDLFPKDYQYNRKSGFSVPLNNWFKSGEIAEYVKKYLLKNQDIFSVNKISKLYSQLYQGYNHGERLYCLFMLSKWMKKHNILL